MFASIQGEGARAGQSTFFIRLSGCNLRCPFCDTEYAFNDGEMMSEDSIISMAKQSGLVWVCLTGGEPFIQDLTRLINWLHNAGFLISAETNGTQPIPSGINWLTVSPKRDTELHPEIYADEGKYVIEAENDFDRIEQAENVYLQPVDNSIEIANLCVNKILRMPKWKLSLQLHKLINVK